MDETEIDQLAISTLVPFLTRLLGWTGATLATAGVTVNFGPDFALKIATVLVGLVGMLAHEVLARRTAKKNVDSAFTNGLNAGSLIASSHPKPPFPTPTQPLQDLADK